jgi:hypothetical protein
MLEPFLSSRVVPHLGPGESVLFATRVAVNKGSAILLRWLFGGWRPRWNAAVLTSHRLLVLCTNTGALLEQHDRLGFVNCRRGGLVNNRSLTFVRADGSTVVLSIWLRVDRLTDQFFREVPELIERRLSTGARVMVVGADGQRHPGTIAQNLDGQCLCLMPDGGYYWFPETAIAAA